MIVVDTCRNGNDVAEEQYCTYSDIMMMMKETSNIDDHVEVQ